MLSWQSGNASVSKTVVTGNSAEVRFLQTASSLRKPNGKASVWKAESNREAGVKVRVLPQAYMLRIRKAEDGALKAF